MSNPLHWSLRVKLPLWGTVLILVAAVAMSASLMVRAFEDLRQDQFAAGEALGRTLARTLFRPMLHDDVWHTFELIHAPLEGDVPETPVRAELILVVDNNGAVFSSSNPEQYPILSPLENLGKPFAHLREELAHARSGTRVAAVSGDALRFFVTPIAEDDKTIGHLVIAYSEASFLGRFRAIAQRSAYSVLVVLALILPLSWYWGRRMAVPLVILSDRMSQFGEKLPDSPDPRVYRFKDELGRLFDAFARMLAALRQKEALERQVIKSERLAALGQLSAGIAHEINNPLAGLLMGVDNLKTHGDLDTRARRTVDLLERGLLQIKDTVGALLVEARVRSRELTEQDIDDVLTLVHQSARKKAVEIDAERSIARPIRITASPVRQILINLLMNAINASPERSRVSLHVDQGEHGLALRVENGGKTIAPDAMERLYEPFNGVSEDGHGLGLWVTYQLVKQMRGTIRGESADGRTTFTVTVPEEVAA